MKVYRGVEEYRHLFLTSALPAGECSNSSRGSFTAEEEDWYAPSMEQVSPRTWLDVSKER